MTSNQETTRVSDLAGVLSLVPDLVGYEPTDSLVVLFLSERRLALTMRCDLGADVGYVVEKAKLAAAQASSQDVVIVAYAERMTSGVRARLVDVSLAIENGTFDDELPLRVFQLAAVTQGGWCEVDPWTSQTPVLHSLDELANHPVRVSSVFAGRAVAVSRDEIAARVTPESETRSPAFEVAAEAMIVLVRELTDANAVSLMTEGLDDIESLAEGEQPDDVTLAGLTVLLCHPAARDAAMLRIDRTNAQRHVDVWSRIVRLTNGRVALSALFLAGAAAWQLGDGAVTNLCAEEGAKIDPEHIGVKVLAAVGEGCLPPDVFDSMKADLRAAS